MFSRMLADYGICCSTPSWLGETPLHAAAQFAQTHVIQFLLNQGVQVYRVALIKPELGTFEWWISGFMLDPLFFLIFKLGFISVT